MDCRSQSFKLNFVHFSMLQWATLEKHLLVWFIMAIFTIFILIGYLVGRVFHQNWKIAKCSREYFCVAKISQKMPKAKNEKIWSQIKFFSLLRIEKFYEVKLSRVKEKSRSRRLFPRRILQSKIFSFFSFGSVFHVLVLVTIVNLIFNALIEFINVVDVVYLFWLL